MRLKSEINPGKKVQMRPLLLSMAMMPAVAATHPAAKRRDGFEAKENNVDPECQRGVPGWRAVCD